MSLDKFRSVKPKKAMLSTTDTEYLKALNTLPEPRQRRNILHVLGTVAASFVLLAAITVWALIGRSIRVGDITGDDIIPAAAVDSQSICSVEITDEMQTLFADMYLEYEVPSLPRFELGEQPTREEIIAYLEIVAPDKISDTELSAKELNNFAYDLFGLSTDHKGKTYEYAQSTEIDYVYPTLTSFERAKTEDGRDIITLTYITEGGHSTESVLSYIPISDFSPDYFVQFTEREVSVSQNGGAVMPSTEIASDERVEYDVTGAETERFRLELEHYGFPHIPLFSQSDPPTEQEIVAYKDRIAPEITTVEQLNSFVYDHFNMAGDFTEFPSYHISDSKTTSDWELVSITQYFTVSEHSVFVIVYRANEMTYTLQYFSTNDISVDFFMMHSQTPRTGDIIEVGHSTYGSDS